MPLRLYQVAQRVMSLLDSPFAVFLAFILMGMSVLVTLNGCSEGKRPIATARVCLPTSTDVSDFVDVIRQAGRPYGMTFFDRTPATRTDLKSLGNPAGTVGIDGFVLNIGTLRQDGMGVTASQLSGPGYQVALGFSEGADVPKAKHFNQDVVHKLKQRWRVEVRPDGAGAQPFDKCP